MSALDLCRLAGIVFLAVTLVVTGDTCGKLLTQSGVDPFIVAWTRFLIAALVLWPLARMQ
ncbi:hypothetical protein [Roseibium sp.]|uniref:hypothetical protein n=1 Tax=Roseibium sp. TaxID=1936156 RepID=UPI003BAD9A46